MTAELSETLEGCGGRLTAEGVGCGYASQLALGTRTGAAFHRLTILPIPLI